MKLSAIFGHLYYRPDYHRFEVRLDGDIRKHVFFADEENGIVDMYVEYNGEIVVQNGRALAQRLRGKVQIEESGQLLLM